MIKLNKIKIDERTQARAELNQAVVAEYAEAYLAGINMPPVVLYFDGSAYWLADGYHRYFGAKMAGLDQIHEDVTPGSLDDAILHSLGANETHGLRRTNADKRKAVLTMLNHSVWKSWSSNEIAKRCVVHHSTVDEIRRSLAETASEKPAEKTYTTKHGTTATMNTANIGKKQEPLKDSVPEPVAEEKQTATIHPIQPQDDDSSMREEMMQDAIDEVKADNDRLRNMLAANMFTGDEKEKAALLDRLNILTKENEQLHIMNRGLIQSRDRVMAENASMRKQLTLNAKKLKAVA